MATTNTKAAAAAKQAAQAPHGAASGMPTQAPQGTQAAQAAAPQAPLFTVGAMPPVRPGTHRHYAQAVFTALAKANPKGFTLAAARQALVANAAASSVTPPRGGWQAHNMPTWAAHPKQAWLVPVKG